MFSFVTLILNKKNFYKQCELWKSCKSGIELPVGCDVQQKNEYNSQQSIAVKQLLQQNRNKDTNLQQFIAVKSNSLCKTNAKSKGKLKNHDSVFSTFEQGLPTQINSVFYVYTSNYVFYVYLNSVSFLPF